MLSIKPVQYASLDRVARDRFYKDLENYLAGHFPEYDSSQRKTLIEVCRAACKSLGIQNEDGIHAYHVVSFMAGASVRETPDYQAAHRRNILIGNLPDQLRKRSMNPVLDPTKRA